MVQVASEEVLRELYYTVASKGTSKTLKDARRWLNEQERMDAPQIAAKSWRGIRLRHDSRDICLRKVAIPGTIRQAAPECRGE